MVNMHDVQALAELPGDAVLSVYVNVDPTLPENQHAPPAYRTWLKHALDALEPAGDHQSRMAFRGLVDLVLAQLDDFRPAGKSMALFAADGRCQRYDLPEGLSNEARFGPPHVAPLRWLLAQHDRYGVVYIDHRELRLLTVAQGRATTWGGACLVLDTSQWTHNDLMPAASSSSQVLAGSDRTTFEHRVDEQERHFWRASAERIQNWATSTRLERLVVGGNAEAVAGLTASFTPAIGALVVGTLALPGYESDDKLLERVAPVAAADAHAREVALVQRVLDEALASGRGALGRSDVLAALRDGRVMTLVAAWPVTGTAWACPACGTVLAAAAASCPTCGAVLAEQDLSDLLPQLVATTGAQLELLNGDAAAGLGDYEGIGALLRY